MVRLIVTAEQAKRIGEMLEPIEILDQEGNSVGYFTQPFSKAEIDEAKRRSKAQAGGRTTQEVLERLAQMESK